MEIRSLENFFVTILTAVFIGWISVEANNDDPSWMTTGQQLKRCSYHRTYHMLGAYCSELNLHILPTTLKSNIEVLDASFNRIRELRNSTFQSYTSLRFLYMRDNLIITIEPLAFEPLAYLEVLDLSLNGLTFIPASILNLVSLRKLYMSENAMTNIDTELAKIEKPIIAPLTFLSLAYCKLISIPDFGVLSELQYLNVSGNRFVELNPLDFATMCMLNIVDLNQSYTSKDVCEVRMLINWFEDHAIQAMPLTDVSDESSGIISASDCVNNGYDEEKTIKSFLECKSMVKSKQLSMSVKKTWIIIGASVGGFLLGFMLLLYMLHRRNVKRMNETNKKNAKTSPKIENSSKTAAALLSETS